MSMLFSPFSIRGVTLKNRVVVSPMCQYSAEDGIANDYHLVHLGRFALGGFGAVMVEATAVTPEGRITHGDMGVWSDAHIEPLARVARFREGARSGAGDPARTCGPQGFGAAAVAWRRQHHRCRRRRAWRRTLAHRRAERARPRRQLSAPAELDLDGVARSVPPSGPPPAARFAPASTSSKCTARTATCSTNSCRLSPTSAAIPTAAAATTACACRSKSSATCAPSGRGSAGLRAGIGDRRHRRRLDHRRHRRLRRSN